MSARPLVSVIIDNFNYAEFLPQTIESALAQTYEDVEIIVVDDGSTDDSRAVLEGFGGRIRVIYQENAGQAAAFNAGVAAARGDIVAFLDSDDAWWPSKVERVVQALAAHPSAGWLRHRLAMVDAGGRVIDGAVQPVFRGTRLRAPAPLLVMEGRLSTSTSSLVLRCDVARRVFPIPTEIPAYGGRGTLSLRHDADAIVVARAAATGAHLLSLDEVLGVYRRHERQQYTGAQDLERMLQRQLDMAAGVAQLFATPARTAVLPSTIYKLMAIRAALAGEPLWGRGRVGPLVRGVRRTLALVPISPRTAMRQLAALAFAYATPRLWTAKLLRAGSYAGDVPRAAAPFPGVSPHA